MSVVNRRLQKARKDAKRRRDELRAANRCICGPMVGSVGVGGVAHGPVVRAGKCQRCLDQHNGPVHHAEAMGIECPSCGSAAGIQCRSLSGAGGFTRIHQERIDEAAETGARTAA